VVLITTSHTIIIATGTYIHSVNVLAQSWPLITNEDSFIYAHLPAEVCVCHWRPPSQVWVSPWCVTVQPQQKPQWMYVDTIS